LKRSAKYIADITVKNISGEIKVYEIVWESHDLTVIMSRQKPPENRHLRLDLLIDNKIIVVDNQKQSVSIGRQGYNDIVIDYSWISRTHAYIEYRKGVFMVVDKSSNGTFVYPDEAKPICINMAERPLSGTGVIIFGREKSDETHNDTVQYAIKPVDGQ
jgi:adenylate cyclase